MSRLGGKIHGVRSDCAQGIRDLQPYNAATPAHDPLWLIYELDRIDKHRLLIAAVAVLTAFADAPPSQRTPPSFPVKG